MDATQAFYSAPSYLYRGSGFNVFAGSRRQRGGSVLGSLAKMVMPVLGAVGKAALGQVAGLANDLVDDAARGRSFRQSLKQRGLSRLQNTLRALPRHRSAVRRTRPLVPHKSTRPATRPSTRSRSALGKRSGTALKRRAPAKKPRNF